LRRNEPKHVAVKYDVKYLLIIAYKWLDYILHIYISLFIERNGDVSRENPSSLPSSVTQQPTPGLGFLFLRFRDVLFYEEMLSAPSPNPQSGGPGLRIIIHEDKVAPVTLVGIG
jgi:hypothetical protein